MIIREGGEGTSNLWKFAKNIESIIHDEDVKISS